MIGDRGFGFTLNEKVDIIHIGNVIIGDNVQIGGGSGVIKNIPDNTKVMGYPAKDLKNFIRDNKW